MRKLLGFWAIGLLGFLIPTATYAVDIGDTFNSPVKSFGSLISVIISNAYIIAGVIVLFLLVFGGLKIIMSAGGGEQQKTAQGKQAITAAVIGFLIIFTSYWIIQIIETITGVSILKPIF
ncbi:hypothetical protein HY404_02540 [Candidatus Microgenomates bacterium]|nr:hypothetical protein [Candidatus Microgenomates bacterium]